MAPLHSRRILRAALGALATFALTAASQAQQAITVPWRGNPNQPHQVISGGTVILQGIARLPPGCTLLSATWDAGDGPPNPIPVPVGNPRVLELPHTYTGVNNQPFIATLTINTSCGSSSDIMRVVVLDRTLTVDVNMAIDRGLWYVHKTETLSTSGGVDTGYWQLQSRPAETASAAQAFEVHGHLPSGNTNEDPYVEDVQRAIAQLFTELTVVAGFGTEGLVNPEDYDENGSGDGNNLALEALESQYGTGFRLPVYILGQVIDAIVATGTPNALATTGLPVSVLGRTYKAIVQDMVDAYTWGQVNSGFYRGGWRYDWNQDSDNSTAQWAGIGYIAAERLFNCLVPAHVKTENQNFWLVNSQTFDGSGLGNDGQLGYTGTSPIDANGMNTTPSGLVQMIADGVLNNAPRFNAAERFMRANWDYLTGGNSYRIYGMYSTTKSMRLALPAPITLLDGVLDWYSNDPTFMPNPALACNAPLNVVGLARRLVCTQLPNDTWNEGYWVQEPLSTYWALIILSDSVLQAAPVAVCSVDPSTTGIGFPITMDGTGSLIGLPGSMIILYEWDFEDDGFYDATGAVVSHAYNTLGNHLVRLRVTDDSVPPLQSTTTCRVNIVAGAIPPNSNPGGPYKLCLGTGQPLILDGTGSSDPDGAIVSYGWDFNPQPLDFSYNDANTPTVDVTAFFSSLAPGLYNVGLQVVDNNGIIDTDFTTVTVYAAGTCPTNYPPQFDDPTPCAQTIPLSVAVPYSFVVTAHDPNPGDQVVLSVVGAPAGSTFTPNLPATGNPVSSTFNWTPTNAQNGTYHLTFTATDPATGVSVHCDVTLVVAECYLFLGRGSGGSMVDIGGHLFPSQISSVRSHFPVTTVDMPSFAIPNLVGVTWNYSVEVVMHNPDLFPLNPDQNTHRLRVTVHPGQWVTGELQGSIDGMHIGMQTFTDAQGNLRIRFPFTIDGM